MLGNLCIYICIFIHSGRHIHKRMPALIHTYIIKEVREINIHRHVPGKHSVLNELA